MRLRLFFLLCSGSQCWYNSGNVAWRVKPRNYLLFACHATNATAQSVQGVRFLNYWYNGGKEKKEKERLLVPAESVKGKIAQAVEEARAESREVADKLKK